MEIISESNYIIRIIKTTGQYPKYLYKDPHKTVPFRRKMKFLLVITLAVAALIINSCAAYTVPSLLEGYQVMMSLARKVVLADGKYHPAYEFSYLAQTLVRTLDVEKVVHQYRSDPQFQLTITNLAKAVKSEEKETVDNFFEFAREADEKAVVKFIKDVIKKYGLIPLG